MNPDKLLDAIGMLDDHHFEAEEKMRITPWRRRAIAFVAAVLIVILSVGTVMAVSSGFRALIFSIFDIETHEQPPAGNADTIPTEESTGPAQSGLQEIAIVNIDGIVYASYFTSEGLVLTYDGGFYTCSRGDANTVQEDAAFWENRADGIVKIAATRMDFPLTHGDRTFQIIFDYAVLNDKLSIKIWPQDLDQNPIGNGWNVQAIGDRTDVALLSVPVRTEFDYTHDYLLLDLATQETSDLLESIPRDNLLIDAFWVTSDLRYAILAGIDTQLHSAGYWFCDLELNTIMTMDDLTGTDVLEPYFLNDSTIIFLESLGEKRINIVSHHIPTGVQNIIIENTTRRYKNSAGYRGIQRHGGYGEHCLLFREDGTVDLVDLRTGTALNMSGLDADRLGVSESPDGTRVLIAYEETNEKGEAGYGFSSLGILNPETGVLQMLTRDVSGNPEYFSGWLDHDTVVITSRDTVGYYVYVYEFREQPE